MTFQDIIFKLQQFWKDQGCTIVFPYDTEKGAGTMSPHTFLKVLGEKPWNTAYVEPSRRPTDGRYAENPNRLQHYFQFQVIMKPSPTNIHSNECFIEIHRVFTPSTLTDPQHVQSSDNSPADIPGNYVSVTTPCKIPKNLWEESWYKWECFQGIKCLV